MATKTVVCPECGSAAAPGRYSCAECGALLAAVALAPRQVSTLNTTDAASGEDRWTAARSDDRDEADGPVDSSAAPPPAAADDAGDSDPRQTAAAAPAGAAGPAAEDSDPAVTTNEPDGSDPAAHVDAEFAAPSGSAPQLDPMAVQSDAQDADEPPSIEPDERSESLASGPVSRPWPPAGAGDVPATSPTRTPAGAYLPPSAVLPPLDGPSPAGAAPGAAASTPGAATVTAPAAAVSVSDRAADQFSRFGAAVAATFGSARVSPFASRRAVAVGAALVAVGLLLPWVNALPGSGPFTGYLDRWGLAGPGLWLVLLAALGLAAVASSSGRLATWPVGLAALIGAAFLVGLVWPYAVGASGRPIGIWTVGVGIAVLIVAGILDRRGRHAHGDASV